MPDPRDEDVARFGKNNVTYHVTRYAEAYDDLANLGIVSRHTKRWKVLQILDRSPDQFQGASCSPGIYMIEKCPEPRDVVHGVAR